MTMVYDNERIFPYNSFCKSEVFLLLVKSGVNTPYRPFVVKVVRFFS